MNNTYQFAADIAQRTGKDRANTFKTLQKLLEKIGADSIESIEHNDDLTVIVINGIRCERPTKRWIIDSHQQKPVVKTVEVSHSSATPVKEDDQSIALAASMLCFTTESEKPIEKREPFYVGERLLVAKDEVTGEEFYSGGILVEHAPDSATKDNTLTGSVSHGVFTADKYKKQLISLFIANGHSEEDAEINANAYLNAFSVKHDPDLTGTYEKVSDDSFMFNGKEIRYDETEQEWK